MRARRPGFTLVELLVVIVLLGIVGSAITRVVVRQQRFYRAASQIIDTRGQLRQAAGVLPAELRGLSTVGGDIAAISATAIEFRANTGSSIACQVLSGTDLVLPPAALASGAGLTAWLHRPEVGDTVFVFDDGANAGTGDDRWTTHTITSLADVGNAFCPPTGTLAVTTAADAAQPRHRLGIAPAVSANVQAGAPIRFTRRVRYSLYRASDLRWYLGYDQYARGAWAGVQPVSGPYLAGDAATPAGSRGMQLRYFDETGTEVTTLAAAPTIARVDLVFRAQSVTPVQLTDAAAATFRDSLVTSVAIRNRQ